MRKLLLVLFVLLVFFLDCQAYPSAEDIIKKVKDVYDKTKSFRGVAEFYVVSGNDTTGREVQFVVSKPDKFRVEDDKFIMASNGEMIWVYDKNNKTIIYKEKYNGYRPDVDYGQFIDNLQNSDLKLVGTESFNGVECYVISAYLKDLKIKVMVYIDKNRFVPVKFETKLKDVTSVMVYKQIKMNVTINSSIFEPPEQ